MHKRYFCAVGRRVMSGAVSRLCKVSKDNVIGVVSEIAVIAYTAHLQTWSKDTFVSSLWEGVIAPTVLVACVIFSIHLLQSMWDLYKQRRRPFPNAAGTTTNIPPGHLRGRLYLATLILLSVPAALFAFIWNPFLFAISPFTISPDMNVILPDLRVIEGLPYTTPPDKDKLPVLPDLFNNEFPETMKAQTNVTMRGVQVPIRQQVYLNFLGKSEFVGFYVPSKHPQDYDETTFYICKTLPREVQAMIKALEKHVTLLAGLQMSNMIDLRNLVFTRIAVIYHEAPLTVNQQAAIIDRFHEYGIDVQFRGPEYEMSLQSRWRNSHKKQ